MSHTPRNGHSMGWGEVFLGRAGTAPETLHYRVFFGFDGEHRCMTYADFQDQWD